MPLNEEAHRNAASRGWETLNDEDAISSGDAAVAVLAGFVLILVTLSWWAVP